MGERTGSMSGGESVDEIRRDIDRTQREMGRTIDEIQHRLSPEYLKWRTKENIRSAGMKTTHGIMDRVRENPLGAAMVGVGLYLMMRNHGTDGYDATRSSAAYDLPYEGSGYGARRTYGTPGGEYDSEWSGRNEGSVARDLRDRAAGMADEARDRVSGAMDSARSKASDTMNTAREATSEFVDEAAERAREWQARARETARRTGMQSRDFMRESPLVAGVAAIALGAIVGAMIPESDREREMFGEASERVTSRAREVAHEGFDRAKEVASHAVAAATETARSESKSAARDIAENFRATEEPR